MGSGSSGKSDVAPSIRFPPNDSQTKHMFRDGDGHVLDTKENRELLLSVAKDDANYIGIHASGATGYAKVLPDGSQAWIYVREGIVQNCGINKNPITDWTTKEYY